MLTYERMIVKIGDGFIFMGTINNYNIKKVGNLSSRVTYL